MAPRRCVYACYLLGVGEFRVEFAGAAECRARILKIPPLETPLNLLNSMKRFLVYQVHI